MNRVTTLLFKTLYAVLFLVIVPALLILWAQETEAQVTYGMYKSHAIGLVMGITGLLLMLWAMAFLVFKGKGLPMNAFPPKYLVKSGPYALLRHPIYWGFVLCMTGCFIYIGSASGIWLVMPVTVLSIMALVLGYENIDLKERFPEEKLTPLLELPDPNDEHPKLLTRLACFFWVLLALLISNALLLAALSDTPTSTFFALFFPFNIQVGYQYALVVLIGFVPLFVKTNRMLRNWALWSLGALLLDFLSTLIIAELFGAFFFPRPCYFLPAFLIPIGFYAIFHSFNNKWIVTGVAVLPFLLLQLFYLGDSWVFWVYSLVLFLFITSASKIWAFLRNLSEWVANSWKEWTFGKVRVINHGFYVGFGAFAGLLFASILTGTAYAWALLAFSITVVVFSALWAQIIEGSEKLKRPYGFYGALVGIVFASLLVWAMGYNPWVLIGVISVMMPWVQGIGRLRCLINGCCHGKITPNEEVGIRYWHKRSRVCNISNMKGEYLHPTPLYSILWLFPIGFILLSLWYNGAAPSFIFGLYLMLNGLGRFVEEAYRGEVQTPIVKGLRLYQWTAILSLLIGMGFTLLPTELPVLSPGFEWEILGAALIGGAFLIFAMGVDFPFSNRRFSRLV